MTEICEYTKYRNIGSRSPAEREITNTRQVIYEYMIYRIMKLQTWQVIYEYMKTKLPTRQVIYEYVIYRIMKLQTRQVIYEYTNTTSNI